MNLDIVTLNLRLDVKQDNDNRWIYRKDSVIEFIKKTKPIILSTQEGLDFMINDLQSNLDDYSHFGHIRKENEEYCTIFYNKNLVGLREEGTFWLSKTPNVPFTKDFNSCCHRICTFGEFYFKEIPNQRFRVYNTHLDHLSELAKIEGIKIVFSKIVNDNQEEDLPAILTGDFNSTVNDDVINFLKTSKVNNYDLIDTYSKINSNEYGTSFHEYRGITEGEPIDFIFVTNHFEVINTTIYREKINNKYLSDHYPIIATIKL